jgi:hypothetical protein
MNPPPERRCTARRSTDGEQCGKRAMKGATVCGSHGGRAPQVKAAAALRVAEEEARRGLALLDVDPVSDPFTALSELAGQVIAFKNQLAGQVNALTGEPCGSCGGGGRLRYEAVGAGTEQLRSEVSLFERALDRCASVLGLIAKLNIDERMARINERQAAAVIRALDAGLAHARVTGPLAAESRAVAARELRNVA